MKRFNKAAPILLLSCVALFSCVDEPVQIEEGNLADQIPQTNKVLTRSTSLETYETLPNPYALDVMQQVYDIYSESPVTLQPTDLYVKFMPKDSLELHTLKYDCDLELFDYPLDIELAEGEEYINYDLPETDLVWLYTTVSPDYVFPQGISYEILEECYIPEEGETVGIPAKAGEVNVEDAAFAMVGYSEMASVVTRAVATPSGTIQVYDNDNNAHVPVKGVKIRCHRFVKLATAYTDENGNYTMSKSFRYSPSYAIIFDNVNDFCIWSKWGPLASASYNFGRQLNTGFSVDIEPGNNAWKCAVVNNAAYEYYQMCEQTGILKPPPSLKIWVWKDIVVSSAPMLNTLVNSFNVSANGMATDFFSDISQIDRCFMLSYILPDITIGTLDESNLPRTYGNIYQIVNHELAHSSHFMLAGPIYWIQYISYIIKNWGYGDGTANNAELCAIGEMWGNYMGYSMATKRGYSPYSHIYNISGWIVAQLFLKLNERHILTNRQIYDCLASNVDTYDELVQKMYSLYPDKVVKIAGVLESCPYFSYNVSLPFYDSICIGEEINGSKNICGDNVVIHDVILSNGATLSIDVGNSITIIDPFYVHNDASLIITKNS